MTKFSDLPDVFATSQAPIAETAEEALTPRIPASENNTSLIAASCRVYGFHSIPVMVDLDTRSVYPLRS